MWRKKVPEVPLPSVPNTPRLTTDPPPPPPPLPLPPASTSPSSQSLTIYLYISVSTSISALVSRPSFPLLCLSPWIQPSPSARQLGDDVVHPAITAEQVVETEALRDEFNDILKRR
eukprot:173805-Hanusia_phi.AAC.1